MNTTKNTRIAVLGGGPGGLTLARVLQRSGVACTVFEREGSILTRPQGGTLDMQAQTGQLALRSAGLLAEFLARSRPEGQDGRLLDKTGKVLLEHRADPDDQENPEIDRGQLRTLLLDSLAPGTVRWHSDVREVTEHGPDGYEIQLADGSSHRADVVVGADGAWSKVRPLLSSAKPEYTGVTFVEIHLDDVDQRRPELAELVGNGSMFALSDNKGLLAQRNSGSHVRVHAALRVPEDWAQTCGIDFADPAIARPALRGYFADWAPQLRALIDASDAEFVPRPLYALPYPHTWVADKPGVTLLGDAAHLMSPFSGLGANLAMLDGAELGTTLAAAINAGTSVNDAITRYESVMQPRGAEAAEGAAKGIDTAISADAPRGALRFLGEDA
ncbi:MAG TPA: NAD(P)/FAD-dependent oxidoreductase [Pseudonocardiaceae bacterium]|nr:NAD(P)/FAD-dependent oxidoreductase [Pseudonocardiaceae bacterium]